MFEVVNFNIEDIKPLLNEPMNRHVASWAENDYSYVRQMAKGAASFTVKHSGVVMLCAFVVEIWRGRGYLVVILSEKIKEKSVAVYRGLRDYLPSLPFNRLEFDSPCEFELGHRRARFLGFNLMCERARRYLPSGADASVYEWVRA